MSKKLQCWYSTFTYFLRVPWRQICAAVNAHNFAHAPITSPGTLCIYQLRYIASKTVFCFRCAVCQIDAFKNNSSGVRALPNRSVASVWVTYMQRRCDVAANVSQVFSAGLNLSDRFCLENCRFWEFAELVSLSINVHLGPVCARWNEINCLKWAGNMAVCDSHRWVWCCVVTFALNVFNSWSHVCHLGCTASGALLQFNNGCAHSCAKDVPAAKLRPYPGGNKWTRCSEEPC